MTRMIINRVLSFLLGAALAIVGIVALLDGGAVVAGRSPIVVDTDRWYSDLVDTRFGDSTALLVSLSLLVLGLALVVLQLWPRPAARVPLDPPDQTRPDRQTSWSIARYSAEEYLAAAVHGEVRLRENRRGWRAEANVEGPRSHFDEVEQQLAEELAGLMIAYPDIRVSGEGRRSNRGRHR